MKPNRISIIMKQAIHFFIISIIALAFMRCGDGSSVRHLPHLGDTPYQQDSILIAYATNPKRALTLLDSALLLGNVSDYRAQFIRAKIYSKSLVEQHQDSAILICKALLNHDSARNEPMEQENILDILIATSRIKHDEEQYMRWATQKAELCQQQGEETERWRTEADIGLVMTFLGQVDEGITKIDEAISHLDSPGSIDRMDAFIIAVKRKINALNDQKRYAEVIPLAQRILDRLDDYEQHPKDYAEDSYRLSWSDSPNDRDRYLDFSRAQAWGFLAGAYASLPQSGKAHRESALHYLTLFNQSGYGQTFFARRMIAPTQMALGMYDEALSTYDEVERRMGADTLNEDYAVILRSRAIAAYAQATANNPLSIVNYQLKLAYDYQIRYAALSKVVSDNLHKSEAHDYAARYHAQEQQLQIQENQAEAERYHIISLAIAVIALLAVAFALYFFRQKRIVSEKNHALVRMISGMPPEPDDEAEVVEDSHEDSNADDDVEDTAIEDNADAYFFSTIDATIRSERLYSNLTLQRQDICDRFDIRRHTLNNLLSSYAKGQSFTQYINSLRMEEAVILLRDQPDMTLTAIAAAVGFTPANLREKFKHQYGMTPIEFRQNL